MIIKDLPIGFVAATLGSVTLANVYGNLGFSLIRHIFNIFGIAVALIMLVKVLRYFSKCREEYKNMVLASLYPAFTMLLMLVAAYLRSYIPFAVSKGLWLMAIGVHAFLILYFTWKHIIRNLKYETFAPGSGPGCLRIVRCRGFKYETFVPSWFVTYFGILVGAVVGKPFNEPLIMTILVYYAFCAFFLVYIPMVIRTVKDSIPVPLTHTRPIFLAPPALTSVGYINHFDPNPVLVMFIYAVLMCAFLYTLFSIPRFFSVPFAPGFAGLTFPMAIGTVSGFTVSAFFADSNPQLATVAKDIAGIQMAVTTVFIYFVLFHFFKLFFGKKENA